MLRIGSVTLPTNLLLAPVAGYCDVAFRLAVRSVPGASCAPQHLGGPLDVGDGTYGSVGLCCTDLLCPQAVLRDTDKSRWLTQTTPEDRPLCMQLYGADPAIMAAAAQWAQAQGAATIDINMGCPVDKVTKTFAGSKLLCDAVRAEDITAAVAKAVSIPVTCKIRLGWDDDALIDQTLPTKLADAGAAAVTVHGRTTAQRFKPSVRLEGIARVVEAVKKHRPSVAVIGNGDVQTPQDAQRMLAVTGCDGVMVARGALGNPWLFRQAAAYLKTGVEPDPISRLQRARLVLRHFEDLCRFRDERFAVHTIRFRIAKYSPHLQPWPNLRRHVRKMRDADEFRDYWHAGLEHIAQTSRDREGAGPRTGASGIAQGSRPASSAHAACPAC
ncbi:MAG: tRNA dihydrouridine synthase DusB [Planctomycetota bacterium]